MITGTAWLTIRARRRRVLALLAFAGLFLAAGATARLLAADAEGHIDAGRLFAAGGTPGLSALVLTGWLIGRFPLIATLVLTAGIVSDDRAHGFARIYAVRPTPPLRLYGARFLTLAALAFAVSAVLLPTFDLLLLGTWAGPATLVLILANVLVFGGLTALLSIWTRGDAWITLLLALAAIVWDNLRRAGILDVPPGIRDVIGFLLPPQAALFALEGAFGSAQPIPWDAFVYAVGYAAVMLAIAAWSLGRREI
ncbi:MAG TPA: hypothetical protein VF188_04110 [Longimicrobiales bacterium]